jgi:branched-chain amino acid transport system ATP-binding protein
MLLRTENLTKSFGALAAVNGVSLAVEAGTLHSIIGPNGAGKTTLFNLLTGTFAPSSGRILLDEKDITGTPAHRVAHLGLARSYQRTSVFPAFTLLENVWVAAFATDSSWKGLLWKNANDFSGVREKAFQALKDVGLEEKAHRPAREISHGEQRQLELAIALAAAPRVLLLDEPAAGVPGAESGIIVETIESLPAEIAVLIIEHDMDLVFRIARRITVLAQGSVLVEGTPEEIARDPRVREVYLGEREPA